MVMADNITTMDTQNPSDVTLDQDVAVEETAMPVEEGAEQKKPAHSETSEQAPVEEEMPPAEVVQE